MRTTVLLLFFSLMTATAAAATAPPREEIERLNREMTAALDRGDGLAVARIYADDARILGPKRQEVRGRKAIDEYWQRIKDSKWKLEVFEVGGTTDEAYQVGRSTLTWMRDGKEGSYTCDFVLIWKRDSSGKLRIHLDLYN